MEAADAMELAGESLLEELVGKPEWDTLSKVLNEEIISFMFHVIPDNPNRTLLLQELIMGAGGDLCKYPEDPHTIKILNDLVFVVDRGKDMELPPDVYSSRFIYDAIMLKRENLPLPDLKKYRVSPSEYKAYDPMKIMTRNLAWSSLEKVDDPASVPVVRARQVALLRLEDFEKRSSETGAAVDDGCNDQSKELPAKDGPGEDEHVEMEDEEAGDDVHVEEEDEAASDSHGEFSNVEGRQIPQVKLIPSPGKTVILKPPSRGIALGVVAVAGPSNRVFKKNSKDGPNKDKDGWIDQEHSDIEDVLFDEDEDDDDSDYKPKRSRTERGWGRPYSTEEDQLIIDKICEAKAFDQTGGRILYKSMAKSKDFLGRRTAYSLENRWKRTLKPKLEKDRITFRSKIKISDEHLKQLLAGLQKTRLCPRGVDNRGLKLNLK